MLKNISVNKLVNNINFKNNSLPNFSVKNIIVKKF